jgi:3-isopropylmalate/(R)-2-methylmalate dehydratase large subunit
VVAHAVHRAPLRQVWDPEKIVIIPDHYIFTSDPRANRNVDILRYAPYLRPSTAHVVVIPMRSEPPAAKAVWCGRDMVKQYGIKYFYDITDRSDFRANPDYKGVCHIALAQEGHCKPGARLL